MTITHMDDNEEQGLNYSSEEILINKRAVKEEFWKAHGSALSRNPGELFQAR